jgi:CheY-like chemotaxis protein
MGRDGSFELPSSEHNVRILVADDDPIAGAVCARALKNAGYGVEVVERGDVALARLQAETFDLVVADVIMPEMDGFALVRAMREDERLTRVPVILLTGQSAYNMRLRGFRAGCDSYLVKPVRPDELVDEVESMLMSAIGTSAQLNGSYLSGRLDGTTLAAILAFLHVQERTGVLRLARFGASGEVALAAGEPHAAYLGDEVSGEPALSAMLGWNVGTFRFEPFDVAELRRNLQGGFAEVMERAQRTREQP